MTIHGKTVPHIEEPKTTMKRNGGLGMMYGTVLTNTLWGYYTGEINFILVSNFADNPYEICEIQVEMWCKQDWGVRLNIAINFQVLHSKVHEHVKSFVSALWF